MNTFDTYKDIIEAKEARIQELEQFAIKAAKASPNPVWYLEATTILNIRDPYVTNPIESL